MIVQLHGEVIENNPPFVVIDVQGVAYEVQVSTFTSEVLPSVAQKVRLYTHFVVREDAQLLFGFHSQAERETFRQLIKINGVGPKLALAILSALTPQNFWTCVTNNDLTQLTRISGVGRKTAERLLVEMRDGGHIAAVSNYLQNKDAAVAPATRPMQEAVSALVALGYKPQDAQRAVYRLKDEDASAETLIRKALQEMAPC
jgi:Holliday junction DNA helicase RuvA